jgi:hypothetical protein
MGRGRLLPADLELIGMCEKPPDNQCEKTQAEQLDKAIDDGLHFFWQEKHEKFHLNVSVADECHGGRKRYGNKLYQHHDVKGTEHRGTKKLGAYDVDAGEHNHEENGPEGYPLSPSTEHLIEFPEVLQHNDSPDLSVG